MEGRAPSPVVSGRSPPHLHPKIGTQADIDAIQSCGMELSHVGHRLRLSVLCLLTCMAVLEFSARGPLRALGSNRDFNDFISPYAQTRAWLAGHDPYAPSTLRELWPVFPGPTFLLKESVDGTLPAKRGLPSPYLDIAFPLLLPIAELPWRIAICVWVLMCVLAVFVSVLLLAPVHTAIAASNIVTVVFALGMIAVFCLTQNRAEMAGVLLTIA